MSSQFIQRRTACAIIATLALAGLAACSGEEEGSGTATSCPPVRSRLHRGRRLLQASLWDLATEHGLVPSKEGM